MLQLDSIMNKEMKEKSEKRIHQKIKSLLWSQRNGGNFIAGMNAWTMGIIRYGAGVLDCIKKELKSIDIKLMPMNGSLHPRGNDSRLYLGRKERGRGLISCG